MAFIAALESRIMMIAHTTLINKNFRFMFRLWASILFLTLATCGSFKSVYPLVTFIREEMLPHIRDSTFALLNTQSFLFVLINSIIFAVLAPSGLFCNCSEQQESVVESSLSLPQESVVESSLSLPQESPLPSPEESPPEELKVAAEEEAACSSSSCVSAEEVQQASSSSVEEAAVQSTDRSRKSPQRSRAKKVRSKMHKQVPSRVKIVTMGNVENDEHAGDPRESERDQRDLLKDEDFKQFIDSFIARAHQQMIRQEREFARSISTARS